MNWFNKIITKIQESNDDVYKRQIAQMQAELNNCEYFYNTKQAEVSELSQEITALHQIIKELQSELNDREKDTKHDSLENFKNFFEQW